MFLLLCVEQQEKEEKEEEACDCEQNIYQSEKTPCPSAYSNHFKSQCDFIEEIVVLKNSFDVCYWV